MRTWTFENKSDWGVGPWQDEPDKIQWVDEATGLDCLMVRNQLGNWCGYVGVAEGHPFFGVDYDQCPQRPPCDDYCDHKPESIVRVHGGLSFASFCQEGEGDEHGICHVPEPGRPEKVWWLGFDCAHCGDLSPAAESALPERLRRKRNDTYKSQAYVRAEVEALAKQLAEIRTPSLA